MRRQGIVVVLGVVLAACGGDAGRADSAALDTCEQIADAAMDVTQDLVDLIDAAAAGAEPDPESIAAVEILALGLEDRAGELGCTDEQMAGLWGERAHVLRAESVAGQQYIEGLKAGEGGFSGEGAP
jgi:hypothetical protein